MSDLVLTADSSGRNGITIAAYVRARVLGRKVERANVSAATEAAALEVAERVVVVLDRDAGADLRKACRRASVCAGSMLVVSLGYPQSDAQDEAIREAIEQAGELGIRFEAILVPSKRAVASYLRPGDALLR